MPVILLRFEAIMQTWSTDHMNFADRTITPTPTFSGVMGVIQATQGIERGTFDEELNSLKMAVRIDNAGQHYSDYQVSGGGEALILSHPSYAKKNLKKYYCSLANGQKAKKFNSTIVNRPYFINASYLIALEGDEQVLQRVLKWVSCPKRAAYLGRSNCIPSRPLFASKQIFQGSAEEVLTNFPSARKCLTTKYKRDKVSNRHEIHVTTVASEADYQLQDRPIDGKRHFGLRYVRIVDVEVNEYE
jgi:CRISPR-associated protein Cas5/CasD subtype I-E